MSDVDAARAVEGLRELARLTGDDDGAQRVAWTDTWRTALEWFDKELAGIDGVSVDSDEAGNVWATAPGESERFVVVGGHLDSVPNGGWLDGALNVVAGLEVLRALAPEPRALTLKLVSWADEEGARFGRSLLGSSACAGSLEPHSVRGLTDRDGIALPDALREHGIDLDKALQSHARLDGAAAYLELHIEQGPVLERLDLPLGAVLGTFGVERHAVRFTGLHAHAGSTPMDVRHDAFLAAARSALAWREDALARDDVRATTGTVRVSPGIVTAFNGTCEVSLDQRSLDADVLADMLARAQQVSREIAADEGCEVVWERIWQIEPIPFNPELIDLADAVIGEVAGTSTRLPSGPLHDAAEMARVIPTVMLFVKSLRGLSHTKEEDTPVKDLELSVRALYELTRRTLEWAAETVDRPDAAPRHQTAGPDAPRR
jgi:N-carbamoyl-L-amino-acid hydrolase